MGMYTELAIGVEFKRDTPAKVIETLALMAKGQPGAWPPPDDSEHPLFDTSRWRWMLGSGGSYYFDAQPCIVWRHDDIANTWFLTVWTNIKNYDGEWDAFLDYIAPHLESKGYIGHMRYEESYGPTLLYAEDGRIGRAEAGRHG